MKNKILFPIQLIWTYPYTFFPLDINIVNAFIYDCIFLREKESASKKKTTITIINSTQQWGHGINIHAGTKIKKCEGEKITMYIMV